MSEFFYLNNFNNKELILLIYLITINLVSFSIMGLDKKKAREKRYRISENVLIFISLIGGAIGSLISMIMFKHKTSKKKFYIGLPIIYIINKIIIILIINHIK